ncbi:MULTISPECIES: outer membrane protein assembly factor BamB family protein [Natrialbaceae]|uniref:outer membrane protein assembly factor BamB family protein n=1 Tax=Natrialbaceae TaxID=1644061 RepID=UPI00207D4D81|nr:PQQ-binding-like beta-propeller repeat protein [Natronococcus sp. CG52]
MPSRRTVLAAGTAAGLAAVAGCLSSGHSFDSFETDPDTWRLSRYDLENTGHNADATVPDDPEKRWRFEPESPVRSIDGLAVGEDVVVAGSERKASDSLVALERETGDVRWKVDDRDADVAAVALGDETVYTTSDGQYVAAYDLETGERRWAIDEERHARTYGAPLLFDGDTLYRGDGNGLTAYDAESGDERWRVSERGAVAIDGDRLFQGGITVTAYESPSAPVRLGTDSELETLWESSGSGNGEPPVVWSDRVLSGVEPRPFDEGERLQAYDADSGDLEWTHEYPDTHVTSPVIVDDRAIFHVGRGDWDDVPDGPNELLAVDAEGKIDWEFETEWGVTVVLAAAGDTLFVGGEPDAPGLAAIDPATGDVRWEREPRGDSVRVAEVTSLAAVDGLLVAGTEHGHVVAYG